MKSLSIVIVSLSRNYLLEQTLVSVLQNRPRATEILVVHRGAYADPYDLSSEVRFIETDSESSLGEVLNVGIQEASGEVVHLVKAGLEVQEGWCDAPFQWFEHAELGSVIPVVVKASDQGIVSSLGVKPSALLGRISVAQGQQHFGAQLQRMRPLGPSIMAGFYRRSALLALGGFDTSITADDLDLEIALALKESGFASKVELESKLYFDENDVIETTRFAAGSSAQRLMSRYREELGTLPYPLATLAAVLLRTCKSLLAPQQLGSVLGRVAGFISSSKAQRGWEPQPDDEAVSKKQPANQSPSNQTRRAA